MKWDGLYRLAHELKKLLHEVMSWPGPMTWRQYLGWMEWLKLERDRPSRDNFYQMDTTRAVEHVLAKERGKTNAYVLDVNSFYGQSAQDAEGWYDPRVFDSRKHAEECHARWQKKMMETTLEIQRLANEQRKQQQDGHRIAAARQPRQLTAAERAKAARRKS